METNVAQIIEDLPKIELHAHLNGSLSAKTLKELGCLDQNICEYQSLTTLMNKTDKTLQECFKLFDVAYKVTNNPNNVYLATKSVIQDFDDDNVVYLELRTTPRAEKDMTREQYIEAVVKAIKDNELDIMVKLILSINRKDDPETSRESLRIMTKMKDVYPDIIKGVDLSGNPEIGTFDTELFTYAKMNGLKTTVHCGEVKNDDEVLKILSFKPDRIGHATFLHPLYGGSQTIWDLYSLVKIPAEMCVTSNIVCGTVKSYQEHHLKEWIKHCLPFSVCTDDKGVFCTSVSNELKIIQENSNLNVKELWDITDKSVAACFATEDEKDQIQRKIIKWLCDNLFLISDGVLQ